MYTTILWATDGSPEADGALSEALDLLEPGGKLIAFVDTRPKEEDDWGAFVYLSPRGGFGQYLGRTTTFPGHGQHLPIEERATEIEIATKSKPIRVAAAVPVSR